MVRNSNLNPLNMVLKTSHTSRIGDAMAEVYQTHSSGATRRRSGILNASPSESHGNWLPVKSAVLDENFAGMSAADHYSRQIYPRNIAFVRLRIHVRLFCHRVKLHSQALDKFEIRVVSSQKEDLFRRKPLLPFRALDNYRFGSNFLHGGAEVHRDLPSFHAILYVRPHPVLNSCAEFRITMYHRDARAVAPQIQRSLR